MQVGSIMDEGTTRSKPNISKNVGENDSFSEKLSSTAMGHKGITIFMKSDDMLYSGANGAGLSFYLKYAENSTEENPIIVAKGIDENGEEFEQNIHVNDINPHNATIVEMRALEAYIDPPKAGRLSSLPNGCVNVGLYERQDFISALKNEIADMRTLSEYGLMSFFENSLRLYEDFTGTGQGTSRQINAMRPATLPSFVGKVYTAEELSQYVEEQVQSNQGKKMSTYDLFKHSCDEGTRARFRFVGEDKIYSFDEFVKEFDKRSKG